VQQMSAEGQPVAYASATDACWRWCVEPGLWAARAADKPTAVTISSFAQQWRWPARRGLLPDTVGYLSV